MKDGKIDLDNRFIHFYHFVQGVKSLTFLAALEIIINPREQLQVIISVGRGKRNS